MDHNPKRLHRYLFFKEFVLKIIRTIYGPVRIKNNYEIDIALEGGDVVRFRRTGCLEQVQKMG